MWADTKRDQFVNEIEKKLFFQREWPNANKKRDCEGFVRFDRARATDVFFNSRFESGNLR